jgi:WD40 repeat protein
LHLTPLPFLALGLTFVNSCLRKKIAQQLHEERVRERDRASFAVVTGMVKAPELNRKPEFRLGMAGGKGRADSGLLMLSNDMLRTVHDFLSWGMQFQHKWTAHPGRILGACWAPNGKSILTCSEDRTLKIWSGTIGKRGGVLLAHVPQLHRSFLGHAHEVMDCAFGPKGESVCSISKRGQLKCFATDTGKLVKTLEGHGDGDEVTCSAFSKDAKVFLARSADSWENYMGGSSQFLLRETATGVIQHNMEFEITQNDVTCCSFSLDGKFFLAGFDRGSLKMWCTATFEIHCTFNLRVHSRPVHSCHVSPDSSTVLSCSKSSRDTTIKVPKRILEHQLSAVQFPDFAVHHLRPSLSRCFLFCLSFNTRRCGAQKQGRLCTSWRVIPAGSRPAATAPMGKLF